MSSNKTVDSKLETNGPRAASLQKDAYVAVRPGDMVTYHAGGGERQGKVVDIHGDEATVADWKNPSSKVTVPVHSLVPKLQPTRGPNKPKPDYTAFHDYDEALGRPLEDRYRDVLARDMTSRAAGRPTYVSTVHHQVAANPGLFPGYGRAQSQVRDTVLPNQRQRDALRIWLQSAGPHEQVQLDHLLAQLHAGNAGTLSVGEVQDLFRRGLLKNADAEEANEKDFDATEKGSMAGFVDGVIAAWCVSTGHPWIAAAFLGGAVLASIKEYFDAGKTPVQAAEELEPEISQQVRARGKSIIKSGRDPKPGDRVSVFGKQGVVVEQNNSAGYTKIRYDNGKIDNDENFLGEARWTGSEWQVKSITKGPSYALGEANALLHQIARESPHLASQAEEINAVLRQVVNDPNGDRAAQAIPMAQTMLRFVDTAPTRQALREVINDLKAVVANASKPVGGRVAASLKAFQPGDSVIWQSGPMARGVVIDAIEGEEALVHFFNNPSRRERVPVDQLRKSKGIEPGSIVKVLREQPAARQLSAGTTAVLKSAFALVTVGDVQGKSVRVLTKAGDKIVKTDELLLAAEEPGEVVNVQDDGRVLVDLADGGEQYLAEPDDVMLADKDDGSDLVGPFDDEDDALALVDGINGDVEKGPFGVMSRVGWMSAFGAALVALVGAPIPVTAGFLGLAAWDTIVGMMNSGDDPKTAARVAFRQLQTAHKV